MFISKWYIEVIVRMLIHSMQEIIHFQLVQFS